MQEFSGHMEMALVHQLRSGTDKIMRDVDLLEDAMSGAGTKDALLTNRVVRMHWNEAHMQQIKHAYKGKYNRSLKSRIQGETTGDYEKLLVACIYE
jgi:annexin A7/11